MTVCGRDVRRQSHSDITVMWSMLAVPNAASDFHANHIIYLRRKRQPDLLDVDKSHMGREPFVIDRDNRSDCANNSDYKNVSDDDSDKTDCYSDIDVSLIQTSSKCGIKENHVELVNVDAQGGRLLPNGEFLTPEKVIEVLKSELEGLPKIPND